VAGGAAPADVTVEDRDRKALDRMLVIAGRLAGALPDATRGAPGCDQHQRASMTTAATKHKIRQGTPTARNDQPTTFRASGIPDSMPFADRGTRVRSTNPNGSKAVHTPVPVIASEISKKVKYSETPA
jgi:hypothetical protein